MEENWEGRWQTKPHELCEECGKSLEGLHAWSFVTTGDGFKFYAHNCCSEECANKDYTKLGNKGYKALNTSVIDTGTNES